MMNQSMRLLLCGTLSAAVFTLQPALHPLCAQTVPARNEAPSLPLDRAQAYYHAALASAYVDEAASEGRMERVTQAIEEYKLALAADPASAELNNQLASLYFHAGKLREAEQSAHALIKAHPDNIDAHKLLGRIYLRALSENRNALGGAVSGNPLEQAVVEYEKLVVLEPHNVEDHLLLGQLYSAKHEGKKAEEQFSAARGIEPANEEVVLNLARLYAENSDAAAQIKLIEAIPEGDRTPRMEAVLGGAYAIEKDNKQAIAAYRRATQLDPGDTRLIEAYAQALLTDEQFDEALRQYRIIAEAEPDNTAALIHECELLRRTGKYEEALAIIREARKKDGKSLEAGYNEGLLLDVLGRYSEAEHILDQMVEQTSHANGAYTAEEKNNRAIFLERLASVYHEQGKTDQAVATYGKMIELGGDPARRGYQGQVDSLRDAKQFDKAIEIARKGVEAFPKDREITLLLAGELADHGKADEGLAMARKLLEGSADDRSIQLAIGQICVRLRRYKEAEEAFAKAAALSTKKEDLTYVYFLRGELAERQKHFEVAEQEFRHALDLDPGSAMTLNYLGYMLADRGIKLPEALRFLRKAVDLDPMSGAYLDSLGWVYFKMGEYELAEENLRHAIERDQADPTVHEHMGDLYEKTGRIRQATAQWEQALAGLSKSASADVEPGEITRLQHKLEAARTRLARQDSAEGKSTHNE